MDALKVIATLHGDFPEKFGIPRQSGLAPGLLSTVVFEPEYQNSDALRGLEGFSHLWLIWGFSGVRQTGWSPTVRPPRCGGNERVGVFATRSPFRPNPIGLSCVRLDAVEQTAEHGVVLRVRGADLMDGSPIYDIKPYLPYADSRPEALGGFAPAAPGGALRVVMPDAQAGRLPAEKREALCQVLAQDPRPAYQNQPGRVYGMAFAGRQVRFTVEGGVLTVVAIE